MLRNKVFTIKLKLIIHMTLYIQKETILANRMLEIHDPKKKPIYKKNYNK